jgi:predicted DNA-binding protein
MFMAAKQTYSVRLDEEQRRQLEDRSESIGLPVGHLIRTAISDFLRQQEEKDYLSDVEARIATAINRLGRQVEKDRAEQQLVAGMLDYLREWLAFALPAVSDKAAATDLQRERNDVFLRDIHLRMVSQGKAKITAYMTPTGASATDCPACGMGMLKCKEGKRGLFWYCTNWNATPSCDARFEDLGGRPLLKSNALADRMEEKLKD